MDNNFDNGFNGNNEPQIPNNQVNNGYTSANPQSGKEFSESLNNENAQQVYAENTVGANTNDNQTVNAQYDNGVQNGNYEQNNQNFQNVQIPQNNDYNAQSFVQPPMTNPSQNSYIPNNNQNYNNPQNVTNGYNGYNQYGQNPQYNYCQPMAPKQKMSGGLKALITILCVLLVFSMVGFGVFVAKDFSKNLNSKNGGNSNSFVTPSNTLPTNSGNDGNGQSGAIEQQTTAPTANHDDTDYSSKTNSNYSGVKLNSKPSDKTSSKYNSEYSFNQVSVSVVGVVCYSDKITSVEDCDSQGSGIILTSDGYVVTNAHVIGNSKKAYKIQIVTSNGKSYNAGVVGFDSRTDLAVLKMDDASSLTPAVFANSGDIELGEDVLAIGNPGGLDYQNSITKGVVSAVNRKLSSTNLVKYIQTDAAINPGNSGGPLVNMYGQVIGITSSKIVSEQFEGMGFAIPTNSAKEIIDELIKQGYISGRVKIGISGTEVSSSAAEQYNVPQGVLVKEVVQGGPCDGTNLVANDIITSVDGTTVKTFADIYDVLAKHKAGDKVKVEYYDYENSSTESIEVTLQEDK